jgi:phosphoribosylglycinamide formyltransferase-1
MPALDIGVLVSGRGSNLQAILEAIQSGRLRSRLKIVVSNQPGALALDRAARAGVATQVVAHREYAARDEFDRALIAALETAGAQWIVLAGFMRVLTPVFLSRFKDRVINIHPALLPAFPGVHAQRQALEYGVKVTGCTVHFVDEGVDTGPIILQRTLQVREDDDESSLSERLLHEEHAALVEAIELLETGRVELIRPAPGKRGRVARNQG